MEELLHWVALDFTAVPNIQLSGSVWQKFVFIYGIKLGDVCGTLER